ncbi:MAG TPA: dTDP-4-dehydrorhamnose reductase, partial [Acidobacteriaceae bacterium]
MAGDSSKVRFLVTGEGGQVGEALRKTLAPLGEVVIPTLAKWDLTDVDATRKWVREVRPRWVVNAAAHTAVDKAESEPDLAFAINATAPEVLADEAKKIGAAMVHYSTDYIFDGSKTTPWVEDDPAGPLNVYGKTKLAGELAVSGSGAPYFTFRTSWVYGATGNNFVRTMLRLARERELLKIVGDQHGAPTWSWELARMTADVIGQIERRAEQGKSSLSEAALPLSGVYHATGSGATTWYGIAAEAIGELQTREPGTKLASVVPIPTSEYPTPAQRPMNSLMNCGKLERTFGWRMPEWSES